jgi:hypothetical protein
MTPRIADRFNEIRARRDELARERDAAVAEIAEIETAASDAELIRAIFGEPKRGACEDTCDRFACIKYGCCEREIGRANADLRLTKQGWLVTTDGYRFGPFQLSRALSFAKFLRRLHQR